MGALELTYLSDLNVTQNYFDEKASRSFSHQVGTGIQCYNYTKMTKDIEKQGVARGVLRVVWRAM